MENFEEFAIIDGECSNYTINQFNTTFNRNNKKFLVMNFNIQCFDTKIDEFLVFLDKMKLIPDIIILSETWFSPSTCREITGYKDYNCTRPFLNDRGGVTIYVHESLNVTLTHYSFNVSPELEHVHITLKPHDADRKSIDIIGIYRPPHRTLIENFLNSLETILNNLRTDTDQILAGDFNIFGLELLAQTWTKI